MFQTQHKYNFYTFLYLCLFISLIHSCKSIEEIGDVELDSTNGSYAIPVLHTKASLKQVIERLGDSTYVSIGPDDLITLTYKGKVSSKTSGQLFEVFQAQSVPFVLTDTITAIPYSPPGEISIDFALLKAGTLYMAFQSYHMDDVNVKVTIPEMTKNGLPFEQNFFVDFNGFIPQTVINTFPLEGYKLQSNNDSIFIKYEAIRSNGMRDTLTNFFMQINDLQFGYAEGYWGNEVLNIDRDTIEIDFFRNWTQGNVYFEKPVIRVNVESSFGFPVGSIVNVANVISSNGTTLSLESPFVDNSINFNYPSIAEAGQTKRTSFEFTKDNSNIRQILSSQPVAIDYDIDAIANPESDPTIRGFITDTSEFKIEVEVDLPIHGHASNFIANETFDFDFCDIVNRTQLVTCDKISSAAFRIATENEMPINVEMQYFVADENGTIIDSLLTTAQSVLTAAIADSDGNVTTPSKKITDARIPLERINDPSRIKKLITRANFSTYQHTTQSVKVLSAQSVDVRMGLKIDLK